MRMQFASIYRRIADYRRANSTKYLLQPGYRSISRLLSNFGRILPTERRDIIRLRMVMTGSQQQQQQQAAAADGAESAAIADTTQDSSSVTPNTVLEVERKTRKLEKERLKAERIARAKKKKEEQTSTSSEKKEKAKRSLKSEQEYVEQTKPGDKKILQSLDQPALKNYNPVAVESAWYDWWRMSGFFEPEFGPDGKAKKEGTFVVPLPPPNVTGALHIGHALVVAIQDALVRWQRMKGKTTLFVVGFDHAGISTQSVVEKRLWKEQGKTRHDYDRNEFVDLVWQWKKDYHNRIRNQLFRLGGSFDWSREAFTMDENLSRAVKKTFCTLLDNGAIYRENRLVHWCTALQTTLSNLEVNSIEVQKKTYLKVPGYDKGVPVGVLTYFAYEIDGLNERIVVATTRPETMLGDTAIAVHPDDDQYKHLHGRFAVHPFVNRKIPIIVDAETVSKDIGTRAVKITPAHDFNDANTGKRHNLEFINILNEDGKLNKNCSEFAGLKRFEARKEVVDRLKMLGLFVEEKEHAMTVPVCAKTGDIIEPILKPQWWLKQEEYADKAADAVRNGELKIQPELSRREFLQWMANCQDWCISRQLWWGHQIPAYFVDIAGEEQDEADGQWWVSGETVEEAQTKAECKFPGREFTLQQDNDVLDTWFSSSLWPFSTLGWPLETEDLKNFYPSSLLETGWDILFFWVAKMVTMAIAMTGRMPFKEVFCHALLRDAQGRKMSKSLGNVIDPIDVLEGISLEELQQKLQSGNLDPKEIQKATAGQKQSYPNGIPQCGADALRFALCAYTTGGRDISLDVLRVEGYRKFCNKIYNAIKFAMMRLGDDFVPLPEARKTGNESLVERWMLHRMNQAALNLNEQLEQKKFNQATTTVYNLWLYELCDVYIEASKYLIVEGTDEQRASARQTLYTCLDAALAMAHPFMPFVTEEMWQRLPRRKDDETQTIMKARFPEFDSEFDDPKAEEEFDSLFKIVQAARTIISEQKLKNEINVSLRVPEGQRNAIEDEKTCIMTLIKKCKSLTLENGDDATSAKDGKLQVEVSPECTVTLSEA